MIAISNNKGFTLVEMTIVFVVMALVMTAGISALSAQVDSSRLSGTRKNQEAIKQALIAFISRNSRLPCPAVQTLVAGSVGYGVESSPGTCVAASISGSGASSVATGMIPFVSLGLADDVSTDGYFNRYTYQVVVNSTTSTGPQSISGLRGYISVHSAGPGTIGLTPTGNQLNDCSNGLTFNPCAAAAIVVSHGKNGLGAFTSSGVQIPTTGAGADELANADGDSRFVRKDQSDNAANPFDDIVIALSPADLLSPLMQNGTLKDPRAVVSAQIDAMKGAIVSKAITAGSGPSGSRTFLLPDAAWVSSNLPGFDPWGNTMIYSAVTSPISALTAPASVAYALRSPGPDGVAGNADDITENISVAEMQAAFARVGY